MHTVMQKTKWMSVGLLLALTCGAPAVADDTELLLVTPNAAASAVPNVLLIIDSSGSMGDEVETREVYDSTEDYPGGATPCDPDYLYWTPYKNVRPTCDGSNDQRILKSAFKCAAATRQLDGIGIYRNTMAQYRDGGSGFLSIFLGLDSDRWQQLEAGNETDWVECAKDRGVHGENEGDSDVYAQRGGDNDEYTENENEEVSWGSWPTSLSYTMYDGNYLNYYENPVLIDDEKINIVNNTAKAILNSIEGVNVGIMRFNDNAGGPVILGMQDLDDNRTAILDTINGIDADGETPVSETLYEAARYWRGLAADYGERIDEHTTDEDALVQLEPEIYKQPQNQACSKNFNVLLTDGAPVGDAETPDLVDDLPDWSDIVGYDGCTGTDMGDCLDDVAAYLFEGDFSDETGEQTVITHTIGFAIDLDILEETALRGGGDYFLADDVESLTLALLEIFQDINDRSLSFAAPAVAVNTFNRTQNLNDLYLTTFAASEKYRWPGNLKKYKIVDSQIVDKDLVPAVDPATGLFKATAHSEWSANADGNEVTLGGAAENQPDPDSRNVYTDITSDGELTFDGNELSVDNVDTFTLADLGLSGSAGEPTKEQLIRWARGEDAADEDVDAATTMRKAIFDPPISRTMGDPLHSSPAAVVYGGTPDNPDVVVFTATNEGFVHAIDADDGEELWAFMPKEHLQKLPSMFIDPDTPFKNYGVDGDIVAVTKDHDGDGVIESGDDDFVYIIFGMRRGGSSYYALDVTNRNSPEVLWRVEATGFGQTWSTPTVARVDLVDAGLNDEKAVVIIGGGYDPAHDTISHPSSDDTQGAGIYFLDLESGEILWRAGADSDADLELPAMNRAIPTQIRVVDVSGDGFADRMYAADMGGQLLRFDIFSGKEPDGTGDDALVTGGVIAQLGAEGQSVGDADTRRFYTSPDVSIFNDVVQNRRFIAISIGSGYRAHPLDNINNDRFYSIRDEQVFSQLSQDDYGDIDPVEDSDLTEVSGALGVVLGPGDPGWKFTLPANQKVLSSSVTFNNEIFFVAFSPDADPEDPCAAAVGRNFLYRVKVANGDPVTYIEGLLPEDADDERVEPLAQGGIAPSPRFLFPTPPADCEYDECIPEPIYCIGVECADPGFENNPVRTLWTQDGIE